MTDTNPDPRIEAADIVTRLTAAASNLDPAGEYWLCPLLNEAAAELTRLRAEVAALRGVPADVEAVAIGAFCNAMQPSCFNEGESCQFPECGCEKSRVLAPKFTKWRGILAAAAPLIRAQERERCAEAARAFLGATSSGNGDIWRGDDGPRDSRDVLDHLPDAMAAAIRSETGGGNAD